MDSSKRPIDLFSFEDALDKQGIFVNGLRGKPAHRESYFTVANVSKLKEYLLSIKSEYSLSEWGLIRDHFDFIGYISPMNSLVAKTIQNEILDGQSN